MYLVILYLFSDGPGCVTVVSSHQHHLDPHLPKTVHCQVSV